MPRRQYIADLAKTQNGVLPNGITDLRTGDDDGQFQFSFAAPSSATIARVVPVNITAMIPDLGDYPKTHEYMLFCDEHAPPHISSALQDVRGTSRKTVFELVDIVAASLLRLECDHDGDSQMTDAGNVFSDDDGVIEQEESEDDVYDSDHEAFADPIPSPVTALGDTRMAVSSNTSTPAFRARLRADLLATKKAGFRVGILTPQIVHGGPAYVSVSIRAARLDISPEAMQAWQIDPSEYITMVIRYPAGYQTANELAQFTDAARLKTHIGFRVVACKNYKPTISEAIEMFSTQKDAPAYSSQFEDTASAKASVRETFISGPLSRVLEEAFIPILRFRSIALPWHGAESWYADHISGAADMLKCDEIPAAYYEPEIIGKSLPALLTADHYTEVPLDDHSFPLLAMQFMLRHFVRCTEFCLICHRKLSDDIEAIKPYVCDRSLCLYQYMTMGFGPSIDHEIMAQPLVVDLLVSFCYHSAAAKRMSLLPDGLSLIVPPHTYSQDDVSAPPRPVYGYGELVPEEPTTPEASVETPSYEVGYNRSLNELLFQDTSIRCPIRGGTWIVLKCDSVEGETHCRVIDASLYPSVRLDRPIVIKPPPKPESFRRPVHVSVHAPKKAQLVVNTHEIPLPSQWEPATFRIYTQDYNDLKPAGKLEAICRVLDTLPSVTEMRDYINRGQELRHWVDRITPAAFSLLRWIIASNRACIMQVDAEPTINAGKGQPQAVAPDRVHGMPGYVQFRFAMGAPDKELRFHNEVSKVKARLQLEYPTIFAWHGSPMYNWHMIIREGLHYKSADHGRAYGHGVYHAKDARTSTGYSGMRYSHPSHPLTWPSSVLNITGALCLSEIVNAPAEFVSQDPFYVVQHLDWIQTRYLFVSCSGQEESVQAYKEEAAKPTNAHLQDPGRTPKGVENDRIIIPASAIRSSKTAVPVDTSSSQGRIRKRQRLSIFGRFSAKGSRASDSDKSEARVLEEEDDDVESVATDTEDLDILFEDEAASSTVSSTRVGRMAKDAETDFVPGQLDFDTLPLLPMPEYASPSTTKHLLKELASIARIQSTTPLAELGWSIDTEKIVNVYQWIVELHSFDRFPGPTPKSILPLAMDMRAQKIPSIVLEVRFNGDFPFSPPYIRVLRPRFKTLMEGGGGHVVQGGAMCMELLTNSGWSSVSTMESVQFQLRLAISSEPYARLVPSAKGIASDYNAAEAAQGYLRACASHGWVVPPGFREMAFGIGKSVVEEARAARR